jgi:hypothetical protein
MGDVYRADDLKLGQAVALKFLTAGAEFDADVIISWSRLLAGSIRDRLVASDVLLGCASGVLSTAIELGGYSAANAANIQLSPRPFFGVLAVAAQIAQSLWGALFFALMALLVLFIVRIVVRKDVVAILVSSQVLGVPQALAVTSSFAIVPFFVLAIAVWFTTLARAGLVALLISLFVRDVLVVFPFAWPEMTWHSGVGFVGVLTVAGLAAAAFRVATSPQSRRLDLRNAVGSLRP